MTTEGVQFLGEYEKLSEQRKVIYLKFLHLIVGCPEFAAAFIAVTPAGEECPPWEVTEQLVVEWTVKKGVVHG